MDARLTESASKLRNQMIGSIEVRGFMVLSLPSIPIVELASPCSDYQRQAYKKRSARRLKQIRNKNLNFWQGLLTT